MAKRRRGPWAIGRAGLLSLLAIGWLGGLAWANITIVTRSGPVAPDTSNAAPPSAVPGLAAPSGSGNGDSMKSDRKPENKSTSTARAKLLAIFLKMFEGHRGPSP